MVTTRKFSSLLRVVPTILMIMTGINTNKLGFVVATDEEDIASSSLRPTQSATPTLRANPSATPTVSLSPTKSATPTLSVNPSATPTVSLSPTKSATPSATPSVSLQPTKTTYPSMQPSKTFLRTVLLSEFPSEYPSEFPSEFPSMFPSEEPTALPSASPSATPTEPPTLSSESPSVTFSPSSQPSYSYFRHSVSEIPYPHERYVAYATIADTEFKMSINELGWVNAATWDIPGSLPELEELSYDGLSDGQRMSVDSIGWSQETWDCYINHYRGYSNWDQLISLGVANYFQTLGWDENSWPNDHPALMSVKFQKLTQAQKKAAKELCYIKETWNKVQL